MYNKTMVDEEVNSWGILFNPKYKNQILMQNSVRDAYCVALSYLGYDINTLEENELKEATDLLISQKSLVQAYVVDQVRDKMIKNAAALGVIYSGEAIYMQRENPDLEYVVPDEGSNVWIDGWVIPNNCRNKEGAESWINFLCRPDIALMNFEYITYSTPNEGARELIEDEEIRNSQIAYPDDDILARCKVYNYLGVNGDKLYDEYWTKVGAK
jgi:spermidine/putrescine-binding protein